MIVNKTVSRKLIFKSSYLNMAASLNHLVPIKIKEKEEVTRQVLIEIFVVKFLK